MDRLRESVSHREEGFESERNRETDLFVDQREHSREPATLSRVSEKEDRIVLLHQFLELIEVLQNLLNCFGVTSHRMPRHRYREVNSPSDNVREDLLQSLCSDLSLLVIGVLRIFEGEQALPDRVRE